MKKKSKRLHLWACIVGRPHSALALTAFGHTRKEVCDILRSELSPLLGGEIHEKRCQKVTVTEGWEGAQKADVLRLGDFQKAGA